LIIKEISNINPYENLDQATSAILQENNISLDDFKKLVPDYFDETIYKDFGKENAQIPVIDNIKFLDKLTVLKNSEAFVDFVNTHKNNKICVIGDYDVDGVFSTLIMLIGLITIGVDSVCVIPRRIHDGYSMKKIHVDRAIEKGASAIITVDNGIGTKDAVDYAIEKGLDILVTDHHLPEESTLPKNIQIIDPKYNGDEVSDICGACVAFKLIVYYFKKYNMINSPKIKMLLNELIFYAACATMTDNMPAIGENRYLLRQGLDIVNNFKANKIWSGRILKIVSGLGSNNARNALNDPNRSFDVDLFSFSIGASINAVSRIGNDVEKLIEDILKASGDKVYIDGYASANHTRQGYSRQVLKKHKKSNTPVVVEILNESDFDFPIRGVIGILANNIVFEERKPAIVGYEKDGFYEFSGRSVPGYSLFNIINTLKEAHPEFEISGGGHEYAMGIKIKADPEIMRQFKEAIDEDYKANYIPQEQTAYLLEDENIDAAIEAHRKLRIFGANFKKLTFTYSGFIENLDFYNKEIQIGRYNFKTFSMFDVPDIGSFVNVLFEINFDYGPGFRITKLTQKEG
jgi:single-stranded-DNA-specific exonuclease